MAAFLATFFLEKNRMRCVQASRLRKIYTLTQNYLPTVKNHKMTIPKHPTDCNYLQRRRRNYFWHLITFYGKSQKIVILERLALERTHFPTKIYTLTHNHLPTVKNHKITIPKHPTDCNYLQRWRRNYFWHFITFSEKSQNNHDFIATTTKKTHFLTKFEKILNFSYRHLCAEFNSNHPETSTLAVAPKLAELCIFNQFPIVPSHDQFCSQIWSKSGISRM